MGLYDDQRFYQVHELIGKLGHLEYSLKKKKKKKKEVQK